LPVPILLPFTATRLTNSWSPATRLDLTGLLLAGANLFSTLLGMARRNAHGRNQHHGAAGP
jgi:hypothetical protein